MNSWILRLVMLLVTVLVSACNERGDTEAGSSSVSIETPDNFLQFLNDQDGRVLSPEWTQAYYSVVDPNEERRTLEAWKAKNGFGNCDDEFHIIFRDAKDLGYGRDMYACRYDSGSADFPEGRFAVFVRNFIVKVIDGDPTNYGPINVEAAIEADLSHHVGTNAIEFSPIDPDDPDSEKVAKFFTFTPEGEINFSADLDGRGERPMPQPCLLCHGSTLQPWDTEAVIAEANRTDLAGKRVGHPWDIPEVGQTIRSAKMNQLEVDSFDYSSLYSLWSRDNQEERFRRFNSYVRDTYVESARRDDTEQGHWCADFAIELALGRYGATPDPVNPNIPCGDQNQVTMSGTYQDDFVPTGWQPNASRPEGVDLLYKRVIEPHCISCHSLRGSSPGQRIGATNSIRAGNAINFNSYENFIGYADIIKDYVFRRGVMPLSLRNYLDFWDDPDEAPAILASFLPGFDLYTSNGRVLEPGRPVAKIGADRTVTSPVVLDASASVLAGSYKWTVVDSPDGSNPVIVYPTNAITLLTTNGAVVDGTYRVRLTVANALGADSAEIDIDVDSAMLPAQNDLTFYDDIRPILQDPPTATLGKREACANCHDSSSAPGSLSYKGIPVYYDDPAGAPSTPFDRNLYSDVLARVDLDEPENSILLRKPTREQHGGGVVLDLTDPTHYQTYNTILNWIRAGAPCGTDPMICPAP